MIRLGLCCVFLREPIRFRTATAACLAKLSRDEALQRLADIARHNAASLHAALTYCASTGIGSFRLNSQILPLRTHPSAGYQVADLPNAQEIIRRFRACGRLRRKLGLRITFHPDQFVVLNSPNPAVVNASITELNYQGEVAEWIGADVITLHAGGHYGNPTEALARLRLGLRRVSPAAGKRLALENDDRLFRPADLLPFCKRERIPFVYDAHHHRCLPDDLSEDGVTDRAMATWNREPLFHISSPRGGWRSAAPRVHSDYIRPGDFPECWKNLDVTVEVEARAKELAVLRLRRWLTRPLRARRAAERR